MMLPSLLVYGNCNWAQSDNAGNSSTNDDCIRIGVLRFFCELVVTPFVKKEILSLNHNLVFQGFLKSAHLFLMAAIWSLFYRLFKSDEEFIVYRGPPARNCARNTGASPRNGYRSYSPSMPLHLMIFANNELRLTWRSVGDSVRHLSNEMFGSTAITDQVSFYQKGHCLVNLLNN